MELIYPENEKVVPDILKKDIEFLTQNVVNWRSSNKGNEKKHYKSIVGQRNYTTEQKFSSLGNKKIDLYKNSEENRIVIEIETSTIENSYNDVLKMLVLWEENEINCGAVIFVQNNRGKTPKLTVNQIRNTWVKSFRKVLDFFDGKIFLYHINQ